MIHLAIVDDHSIVLQGLELMLKDQPNITLHALCHNADELMDALNKQPLINTILMDIHMPDTNGVELCKVVKREYPDVKVVGLSMVSEISLVKLMVKNGAVGYLHKNADKDEVITALERVASGRKYFSEEISDLLFGDVRGSKTSNNSPFPRLSRREKEVLQLIVDEYTTQEIADQLFISFGTVETHRRNILSKLGARNTAGLVRIALEYQLL